MTAMTILNALLKKNCTSDVCLWNESWFWWINKLFTLERFIAKLFNYRNKQLNHGSELYLCCGVGKSRRSQLFFWVEEFFW